LAPDAEKLLREALALRSAGEVWAHLAPLRPRLDEREIALAWMTLAQASPRDRSLPTDAARVLEVHPIDPEVLAVTLTALCRRIDAAGIDAPVEVAAQLEAGIAAADKLDVPEALVPALSAALGNAILRLRPDDEAGLAALERAIKLDPEGPWLLDLVRVHKRARRFRAGLAVARNARKRHGAQKSVLVELAIVALGAGEPKEATEALRELGLSVESGEASGDALPFVADLPLLAVRVPSRAPEHGVMRIGGSAASAPGSETQGAFETVWVQPLSPMHGVVRSATFREAVTDFGDVILFDVAPIAMVPRPGHGKDMERKQIELAPLVPFLMVLRAGDERRLRFLALEQTAGQVRALMDAAADCPVFFHAETVERVCARCMAGETLVKHEHLPPEDQRFAIGKLVVPASLDLATVAANLERAKAAQPGVLLAIPALYELLGRTPDAGKHHKTWGAIERGLGARS
jgi:hypothetical protein